MRPFPRFAVFTFLSAFVVVAAGPSQAQDSEPPSSKAGIPALQKMEDGRFRLGNIVIDKAAGRVSCPASVNMDEGLIEVFAATEIGKLHESALVVDVVPLHLQLALITLGLEPGDEARKQESPDILDGDPVRIYVEWEEGGQIVRHRAEDLIWNSHRNESMRHVEWVFVGSQLIGGTFMANVEGQLVTTYRDALSIVDNPLESSAVDDTSYQVHAELMPPVGTPVSLVFEDARRRAR